MATPNAHAFLSASSAARWAHCTASPHFEKDFPSTTSVFAEEGTLAHSFCELYAKLRFTDMKQEEFSEGIANLQRAELYDPEMLKTAEFYADYLWRVSLEYKNPPHVVTEVRLDLTEYIPEGFGTSDCILIGDGKLTVVDYKHGKGVAVSAKDNFQMRLYALGALKRYAPFFSITQVMTAIVQPRIREDASEGISEELLTAEELGAWGEWIKPLAQAAFTGEGVEFHPGDWCHFCRGRAACKARADNYTALEDFKDIPPKGKANGADIISGNYLTNKQIGDLLNRAEGLKQWAEDLKDYALGAILNGETIPGYKVVEGRSQRKIEDPDKAVEALLRAGYPKEILYEYKLRTLTALEKAVGKKDFTSIAGEFIVKPAGAPTLVPESDRRKAYSPAAADFREVAKEAAKEAE